jgi:RNA polymerase sigma-70 factor (ECF subfamily)
MRALPPEDREALSAIGVFGLSYQEAAVALDIPVGTVKSRVFRARRMLVQILSPQGGDA